MSMNSAHHLAALIEQRRDANGWSNQDIAQRARREGHQLSHQNISRICNNPVIGLKADLARALASGLDLPVEEVVRATLLSMGFQIGEGRTTPEEAVKSDPDLSSEARQMLLTQLKVLRKPARPALRRVARKGETDD